MTTYIWTLAAAGAIGLVCIIAVAVIACKQLAKALDDDLPVDGDDE